MIFLITHFHLCSIDRSRFAFDLSVVSKGKREREQANAHGCLWCCWIMFIFFIFSLFGITIIVTALVTHSALNWFKPHHHTDLFLLHLNKPIFICVAAFSAAASAVAVFNANNRNHDDHTLSDDYELHGNSMHVYRFWIRLTSHRKENPCTFAFRVHSYAYAESKMQSKSNSLSVRQCKVRDSCQIVTPTLTSGPATKNRLLKSQFTQIFFFSQNLQLNRCIW